MKAAYYTKNGPASEVLQIAQKPKPEPVQGEVLVRIHASGVNPSDVKSRAGRPLAGEYVIPHSDGAGIIEAVGDGVTQSRIGERIWIWNGQWQRSEGTCAEYIALPSEQAVKLPDNVNFATGACLGIPGLTAAHAINQIIDNDAKSVLVTGAASSVGSYVCQMARYLGLKVIGTASEKRKAIAFDNGCDEVIDYKNEEIAVRVAQITDDSGVDAIVDMDFSSTTKLLSTSVLKPHGQIICYGSNDMGDVSVPFRDLLFKAYDLRFFLVYELTSKERIRAIDKLKQMLENGVLNTRIAQEFALEEAVMAHEMVESGLADGNIIISL